jgi:FK506-binding nuclear protein
MAAIDPTEDTGDAPPRATLKIIHNVLDFVEDSEDEDEELDLDDVEDIERRLGLTKGDSDEDEEDDDEDEDEDEDMLDEEDEMVNGGPSDPEKRRNARGTAFLKALQDGMLDDMGEADEDEKPNGFVKLDKGKGRAVDVKEEDMSDDVGMEEYVVCTLDRNMVCLFNPYTRG